MIIYSSYHDEYFEVKGRASKLVLNKESIKAVAEWLLGYEVPEVHVGIAGYFDAVFAADVWVKLNSELIRLLFVDTPVALSEVQWEKLLIKIDRLYVKFWGIKVEPFEEFDEVFSIIVNKAKIFGEDIIHILSVNRYELQELLGELIIDPWNALLLLDDNHKIHLYLLPRVLLKYMKKELRKRNVSFKIIKKP